MTALAFCDGSTIEPLGTTLHYVQGLPRTVFTGLALAQYQASGETYLSTATTTGTLSRTPDPAEAWHVYVDLLGFRLSDTISLGGSEAVFLHCNTRHHSVAFFASPAFSGLQLDDVPWHRQP